MNCIDILSEISLVSYYHNYPIDSVFYKISEINSAIFSKETIINFFKIAIAVKFQQYI